MSLHIKQPRIAEPTWYWPATVLSAALHCLQWPCSSQHHVAWFFCPLSFPLHFSPSLQHPLAPASSNGKNQSPNPHQTLQMSPSAQKRDGTASGSHELQRPGCPQHAAQCSVLRNRIRERVLSRQILALQWHQLNKGEERVLGKEKETFISNHNLKTATLLYYSTWYCNIIKKSSAIVYHWGMLYRKKIQYNQHNTVTHQLGT